MFAIGTNAFAKVVTYKVKNGDTLYTVAHKHHSSIKELLKLNGLKRNAILKAGKVVRVATNTYKSSRNNTHSLTKTLNKHALPLGKTLVRKKRKTVVADNLLFKSSKYHSNSLNGFGFGFSGNKSRKIISLAKTKLGQKYVWGAVGQKGTFDCSGFTSYVYRKNGIILPRTSFNQAKFGKLVSRHNLRKGDLIFFDTSKEKKGYVNHVGIYIGNGKFIHASSAKKKVVISKLTNFYAKHYMVARRPI